MTPIPRDQTQSSTTDDEARLQEELRRESEEHSGLGGDVADNRNLSGAGTWVTLPAQPEQPNT